MTGAIIECNGVAKLYGDFAALLGLVHQRFVVIGILYWLVVEMGLGMVESNNINQLCILRHVHTLMAQNEMVVNVFQWSTEASLTAGLVLGGVTLFFLAAGAALFTFREYLPSQEADQ
jgi:hypothetical protein